MRLGIFIACVAVFSLSALAQETKTKLGCVVLVQMSWSNAPENEKLSRHLEDLSRSKFFNIVGTILQDSYAADAENFPFHSFNYRGNDINFAMFPGCSFSFSVVSRILQEYRSRLTFVDRALSPDFTIRADPGTIYQLVCGIAATRDTCPDADEQFY